MIIFYLYIGIILNILLERLFLHRLRCMISFNISVLHTQPITRRHDQTVDRVEDTHQNVDRTR